jgi:methionyl-tRNA formyltransferase
MDEGIDTGDIIARRQVAPNPVDTGETLYFRLEAAALQLFKETWPLIRAGQAPRISQDRSEGSSHRVKDVEALDEIDLEQSYPARELIDILRARTFPPYNGAYFRLGQQKIFMRLHLYADEATGAGPGIGAGGQTDGS